MGSTTELRAAQAIDNGRDAVKTLLNEFKDFITRGNVVDLAIAVVVGAAFSGIVTSFVKDLLTPLIAAIGGQPDFSGIYFTIHNSKFAIGDFINSVVSFLIIAAVIFFLVVKPLNWFLALRKKEVAIVEAATSRECPYCLSEIPVQATRCAFCTQEVPAVAAAQTH
jgi:large conductance mechanosensitive channel